MLTQSEAHMSAAHKDHQLTGAVRSGEGSKHQVLERMRLFEESERLDEIEESREIVADKHLQDQLF